MRMTANQCLQNDWHKMVSDRSIRWAMLLIQVNLRGLLCHAGVFGDVPRG